MPRLLALLHSAKSSLPILQALVVQECCSGCARLMHRSR